MSSRARNGRLGAQLLERGAVTMVEDLNERVQVYRKTTNGELCVADFSARIATGTRSLTGRDNPQVQGTSAPQYSVLLAPLNADIKPADEAWSGDWRYRVVSVDPMPHRLQVLLLNLQ